ncbi:MAG: VOC family protein [Pseudomonadota bacterium]
MALNHLALSTHDPALTHAFYTQAMGFKLVGIEADDTRGNKYKHCFYDTGDGAYLAFYDLNAFGAKAHREAQTDIAAAMGLGPSYVHVAWEAGDREGLDAMRDRWLAHGLEVMESSHHKDWMYSIYTFDPNGLLVEAAYVDGTLTDEDAQHAFQIFVEQRGLDEIGYPREGLKSGVIHLPSTDVARPQYYTSIAEKMFKIDIATARGLPFVDVVQH